MRPLLFPRCSQSGLQQLRDPAARLNFLFRRPLLRGGLAFALSCAVSKTRKEVLCALPAVLAIGDLYPVAVALPRRLLKSFDPAQ